MLEGSTEDLFRNRSFGERVGHGSRPAVVVIDLQVGLTQPGFPLYGNHDEAILATRRLVESAHKAEVPVVYTVVAYDRAEIATSCYTILRKMPAMKDLIAGSECTRIDPRLPVGDNDIVLIKKGQSAFLGTPLGQILTGLGIDTLFVAGANTSGCVRGSVMDATTLGYRVQLVEECLGDVTKQVHDASIFDMDAKNGDLISLKEASQILAGPTG